MDLDEINKTAFKETVKREIMFIKKIDKYTRKANYTLSGRYVNSWQANNAAINHIMNLPLFIDINGNDATQDVHDDVADNYGLDDTDNVINNLNENIENADTKDEKQMLKTELNLAEQVHGDWTEDRGYTYAVKHGHNVDNYYTDVTYPAIYGWVKDIIKILHADSTAIYEA